MERIVKGIWIPIEIWQDTDLSWNEKILLMEIDSFTSRGRDCFISNEYISNLLGVTERMASTYLSHLVDLGYVTVVKFDGRCRYVESNYDFQAGWKETSTQDGKKLPHTDNNIQIDKKDTARGTRFNFKSALLDLGVSEDVVDSWLTVRRNKRATNTEIAFRRIKEEILKSGMTPQECITICVENSWQGFKSEWLQGRSSSPKRKETYLEHNLRVMDQMYGTNMHEQTYGRRKPDDQ